MSLRAVAIADQQGPFPDRALSELSYTGTPEELTAALLVQAAATILYTKGLAKVVGGGGVLTPAVLGSELITRLGEVGVEIEAGLV